jgi:hypothetical protein
MQDSEQDTDGNNSISSTYSSEDFYESVHDENNNNPLFPCAQDEEVRRR